MTLGHEQNSVCQQVEVCKRSRVIQTWKCFSVCITWKLLYMQKIIKTTYWYMHNANNHDYSTMRARKATIRHVIVSCDNYYCCYYHHHNSLISGTTRPDCSKCRYSHWANKDLFHPKTKAILAELDVSKSEVQYFYYNLMFATSGVPSPVDQSVSLMTCIQNLLYHTIYSPVENGPRYSKLVWKCNEAYQRANFKDLSSIVSEKKPKLKSLSWLAAHWKHVNNSQKALWCMMLSMHATTMQSLKSMG